MNWVALQAYGNKDIFLEARFLLVTTYPQIIGDHSCKVIVYTDSPDEVKGWGFPTDRVVTKLLDQATISKWKGPDNFVHRLKIEMLLDAAESLTPEKILYLDSDMILKGELSDIWNRIRPGYAVMHEAEGKLSSKANPILRKMHRFVRSNSFPTPDGSLRIDRNTEMHNAGVIGLHQKDFGLLGRVLALTDSMYTQYPKHVIEQLAFSSVLGEHLEVYDASPQLLHYWYAKEIRQWLARFFDQNGSLPLEIQLQKARKLDIGGVASSRLKWKNKASWKRKLLKAIGKDWIIPPYPSIEK